MPFSLQSITLALAFSLTATVCQAIRITYPTTGSYWVDHKYNPLIWQSETGDPPLNSFHAVLVNITEMQREADDGWKHGVTAYSPTGVGVFYPPDQWPHGMETANISDTEWACYLHTAILQGENMFQINLTSILVPNYGQVLAYSQPFTVKLPGAAPELPNDPAALYVVPTATAISDDSQAAPIAAPIASQPARVTNVVNKADSPATKSNSSSHSATVTPTNTHSSTSDANSISIGNPRALSLVVIGILASLIIS